MAQWAAQRPSVWGLRWRDPRKNLDVQIAWEGGPDGLWRIQARGITWRVPDPIGIGDVMRWINRTDQRTP